MRGGNLLDLILTHKEVLAGDVKDKGSLGCIDQEVVESGGEQVSFLSSKRSKWRHPTCLGSGEDVRGKATEHWRGMRDC